ncbi:MAG TPA: ATP-binding protein [Acidimicrobiales bacterium]|nr:ATP-binding protein [Acidimicrobiales bacterium]
MRKELIGSVIGVLASAALGAAMLPVRSHLAVATAAVVLVVPVVAGVVSGGLVAGLVSVAAGFLVYDYFFVPPYATLQVGSSQDWVALGVYVVVMVLVAGLVNSLDRAREVSRSREANARHLLELSELLLADKPVAELSDAVVAWAHGALGLDGVALLLSVEGHLEVVASSGTPISPEELHRLQPGAQLPVPLTTGTSHDVVQALALASSGRPVGLLLMRSVPSTPTVRELLPILANHLAIALERAQLRERILHAELLEEVDRLRRSLIGAVSHDLRTPLATIKVASSTFLDRSSDLSEEDANELHGLIDMQADRLTRLVNSLLDMTRIQSGSLEVRRRPWSVRELVSEALSELQSSFVGRTVDVVISDQLPLVDVDPLLIELVLANLLDNANRHGPPGTPVTVSATTTSRNRVRVAVSDRGAGVPLADREAIFERFVRFDTGGRSGLGLAIAKAFVEAHGDRIWVEGAPGDGARFVFTLPLAPIPPLRSGSKDAA